MFPGRIGSDRNCLAVITSAEYMCRGKGGAFHLKDSIPTVKHGGGGIVSWVVLLEKRFRNRWRHEEGGLSESSSGTMVISITFKVEVCNGERTDVAMTKPGPESLSSIRRREKRIPAKYREKLVEARRARVFDING